MWNGPMPAYTCYSQERSIGRYKRLIKSKSDVGANANAVMQRMMIHSYVHNLDWDISDRLYLLGPRPYSPSSFENIVCPDTSSAQQMRGPFEYYGFHELPLQVPEDKFLIALNHFYIRALNENIVQAKLLECCAANGNKLIVSGRVCQQSDENKDIVWKSILYAENINEHRRGNTIIMFYATNSKYVFTFDN